MSTQSIFKNVIASLCVCTSLAAANDSKPNIILIMADDLGWGDVGFNGNTIIRTPNLDQMAAEGVRFNRFYSASAVSSPTRASVLTGRNPSRTGVFSANVGILRPEEITIAELLQAEGYATGHFGKWHLGTLTATGSDANRGRNGNTKEFNPPALHGYDAAFVTESKVPTFNPMIKPTKNDGRFWDCTTPQDSTKPYGTAYWDINNKRVTDNLNGDDSRIIMDRVIPFIGEALENDKPFLSVVWFHTPHLPCVASPKHAAMYANHDLQMRNYAGCITAMDEQVGRLRTYLKSMGADENTMIWFCSDNGPERVTPGTANTFTDRKRSLHEGGVRVPALMVWPAKVQKPIVTDYACVTSDYFPTIVEAVQIPQNKVKNELDGTSLIPLISNKTVDADRSIGFMYSKQIAYHKDQYKLYMNKGKYTLYDIVADPSEKNDLSSSNPKLLKRMQKEYKKWYNSCKESFEGAEYGTKSFNMIGDKWDEMY